ncbi:hypothetical protein [Flavobacterium sp.]|uniref:hypothetical protein n=1 Tax=Flavobacterium sp. TaxID=239 RepID=UPI003D0CD8FE
MNTNEKIAVEQHLLKVCGFHRASREYKLIQLLFNNDELDFISTNRDDALELRKELWFLKFECPMQWNKVILTDDAIVKYYENVMGLITESKEPQKSFYDIKRGL